MRAGKCPFLTPRNLLMAGAIWIVTLTREEKERFLRALEEDREFRYAVMGLIGYREVLEAITELRKAFARLEERQARLEEMQVKLEERQVRLEERQTRLEERQARLEERQVKLEEMQARLEERQTRLEVEMKSLREEVKRVWEELRENRRLILAVAHRFGVISEEGFREAMRYVVQEILGAARVERVVLRDDEGTVYGHPAIVEVDVAVSDRVHVIVEVKSRVSRADVAEIKRVEALYRRARGVKPRLLIVGGLIDRDAWETASRLGVELKPAVKE